MPSQGSSLESQDGHRDKSPAAALNVLESVLTRINFAGESSILQLLEERVQLDPAFEKRLFTVLERSTKDKTMRLAAANASTILNVACPVIKYELPEPDQRIISTSQLRYCLSLLPSPNSSTQALDETERAWSQATVMDLDEQTRLRKLAAELLAGFSRDDHKLEILVAEVVCIVPILDQEQLKRLRMDFIGGIREDRPHMVEGLAQLMLQATPGHLNTKDLAEILEALRHRLLDVVQPSGQHVYKLALAVSHILDAAADCQIKGCNYGQLLESFSIYLNRLKGSIDPYLVYQAAHAFQALLYASTDKSVMHIVPWHAIRAPQYNAGLARDTKDRDLECFVEGLSYGQGLPAANIDQGNIPYQTATLLVESGKSFLDSIEGSFKDKSMWYPALRGVDTLLQGGQLARSKKLIYRVPCRRDPAFQWGVCQRLGDLASNSRWDEFTRQNAVTFLGEIYVDDAQWGQNTTVKKWIVNILTHLKASTKSPVKDRAGVLLQELENNGDAAKRALFQLNDGTALYPLTVALPQTTSSLLLDSIQNRPDVEADLQRLKEQRLKERSDAIYVPPQAKASVRAQDTDLFDLMEKANKFLDDMDQKVLLLLGEVGVGKSTFKMELESQLWSKYEKRMGSIPLFISLPTIFRPEQELIVKQLRKVGFEESQIRVLKERKFVLICDGYDESQRTHNLYMSNRFNQEGEWKAQMVISCRSKYIGLHYQDAFWPGNRHQFQEAVVMPFNANQVNEYIKSFVLLKKSLWSADKYINVLEHIPSLKDLIKDPFLLTLSLDVLPRLIDPNQTINSAAKVTRTALYDEFLEQWLERGKKQLADKDLSAQEKKALQSLSDDGFARNGIDYLKRLATEIYNKQNGNPVIKYSRLDDVGSWKDAFFGSEDDKQLLRDACPLTRSGNEFRFIHRSFLEYGLARAVFDPQNGGIVLPTEMLKRRGSAYSFEMESALEDMDVSIAQGPDDRSPLFRRSFVGEPSVLQFLVERAKQGPVFKYQLLEFIESSKVDKKWRTAAANAITILVRAGVNFNGVDLKGVQIPQADLSGGQFDSAQLEGADLRKANLRNIWLRQANLSRAQMAGVQFGEWPYLLQGSEVLCCSYSPNGETCVLGLRDGTVSVYDTITWAKTNTFQGHVNHVTSVLYSPSGHQIASGSLDKTVRLWDTLTGTPGPILTGHTDSVTSVVYSPSGHQIASGSLDNTVRLWDTETGALGFILHGHTDVVTSVVYSPSGHQIASGSRDKTVRLWDTLTGSPGPILTGHTDSVTSVVYSPSGHQIASA
ncbi:hypothetical protein BGZ83_009631, partial [Gryganskiella cystojenkinii]